MNSQSQIEQGFKDASCPTDDLSILSNRAREAGRSIFLLAVPDAQVSRLEELLKTEDQWTCLSLKAPSVSAEELISDEKGLGSGFDTGGHLEVLLRRLGSEESELRVEAASILGSEGFLASMKKAGLETGLETDWEADLSRISVALFQALEDSSAPVREGAARAFASLKLLDDLIDGLLRPRAGTRRSAAWALGFLGASARIAVPALIRGIGDSDPATRRAVAWALERITLDPEPIPSKLGARAQDRSEAGAVDMEEFERWLRAGVRSPFDGRYQRDHPGQLRLYRGPSRARSSRARVS